MWSWRLQPVGRSCASAFDRDRKSFLSHISSLILALSLLKSAAPSASGAPFSARPAALHPRPASGTPPFYCQTSEVGCTSQRKPAVPGSPLPVLCRGGWLSCFIQLHWVEALGLLRSPAYSFRAASNSAEYFCSCSSSRFRLCSMAAMSLGNLSAASSSVYASDARSRFFSERNSSKSSVSAAIFAASSRCRNTWTAESAFFSVSRLRRSFVYLGCPLPADCTV